MCIVFPFLVFFRFSQNDFTQLPELVRWAPTGLRSLLHHDIYMYHVWGRRKQCAKMLRPSPQKFSVMALYIVWLLYSMGLWTLQNILQPACITKMMFTCICSGFYLFYFSPTELPIVMLVGKLTDVQVTASDRLGRAVGRGCCWREWTSAFISRSTTSSQNFLETYAVTKLVIAVRPVE